MELVDLALEGISALWVKYTNLLAARDKDTEQIFDIISRSLASTIVQPSTKAQIVKTIVRFLTENAQKDLPVSVSSKIASYVSLCGHEELAVRQAAF